jgi:hypothetical protein
MTVTVGRTIGAVRNVPRWEGGDMTQVATLTLEEAGETRARALHRPSVDMSGVANASPQAPGHRGRPHGPSVHLVPAADTLPVTAPTAEPGALLRAAAWRAIDRTGLRHLAHMLARYPKLATGMFLPALTMSVLFFLMSDGIALLLGAYSIAMGFVFAVAAAREMARDGIDFSAGPDAPETP